MYGYVYIGTCISVYICVDMFICVYNVCEWMLVAMKGSPFVLNEGYLDQTPLTAGTRSPLTSHCVNMIYFISALSNTQMEIYIRHIEISKIHTAFWEGASTNVGTSA